VLDEYGGTAGLVTLEDWLEEVVGEMSDPFDSPTPEFETMPDGSILIDGLTLIEDVDEALGIEIEDPYYDTIAGYVMGKLARIPRVNDVIETNKLRIRVEEMDGMRISRLSFMRLSDEAQSPQGDTLTAKKQADP